MSALDVRSILRHAATDRDEEGDQEAAAAIRELLPALERARVVAVLDGWAKSTAGEWSMVLDGSICRLRNHHPDKQYRIDLSFGACGCPSDAARAAAAQAIESGELS